MVRNIGFTSEYLTTSKFSPTKNIAKETEYGGTLSFLNGLKIGFQSNSLYGLYLLCIFLPAYHFAGIYGICMASLGMLSVTTLILSTHFFKPLTSNIIQLITLSTPETLHIQNLTKMETIANTTVALGNGFSSGTSLISTISLFLVSLQFLPQGEGLFESFQLLHISGLLIGLTMPYIVGNTLLTSLRHTIKNTVSEVVRQFKEIPFLIEKKAKPDMIRASDLTTFYTMNALILPGIIMILCPLTLGFIFGPEMIITLSIGCILTAYQQSFDWSNLGDSLHNAKNHIESGHFGGKNSPNFQHIRPIEKIGIMYKDLLSPSNNILIKTLTIVGLLVIISLNL